MSSSQEPASYHGSYQFLALVKNVEQQCEAAKVTGYPMKHWIRQVENTTIGNRKPISVSTSDKDLEDGILDSARRLYGMQVILPSYSNYPSKLGTDPQFQARLEAKIKGLTERLDALKLEIMNRTQIEDTEQQQEVNEAWNGLKRTLHLDTDPDAKIKEGASSTSQVVPQEHAFAESGVSIADIDVLHSITSPPSQEYSTIRDEPPSPQSYLIDLYPLNAHEYSTTIPDEPPSPHSYWIDLHPLDNITLDLPEYDLPVIPEAPPTPLSYWIDLHIIDDYGELASEDEFEDFSAQLELASSHGPIPDEAPSPISHWVDLHPIENSIAGHLTHQQHLIPEEPPLPLSHWIDLHVIEDRENLTPEVAPEPTSMFLELYPLQSSSPPEESPSPTEITLRLYESQD